ncbi:metallophosphoesterase [Chungangia koreensis]|uniref:Metallophosphoesterase n=1 Tax=Chungangia koreensis TaxID=752657 RepID=A0ABV8X7H1_9LACT
MFRKLLLLIAMIVVIAIFLYANNHWLQTTEYTIESPKIPKSFDGFRIVQLSDLHDSLFGEGQEKLVRKVEKLKPDAVFITGDLIDSNRYNLEQSMVLVEKLVHFTDVYYVTGNHEVATRKVDEIKAAVQSAGAHVLSDESVKLTKDGESVALIGIDDPLMRSISEDPEFVQEAIEEAVKNVPKDEYKILLSHRPEFFDTYVQMGLDITFSGHAHGGQVRIPGVGGLNAPGQGWFPEYTSGRHISGNYSMIISRGLGNSIIQYRVFNRPEIVFVTLSSKVD